jgi:hypothetical protein
MGADADSAGRGLRVVENAVPTIGRLVMPRPQRIHPARRKAVSSPALEAEHRTLLSGKRVALEPVDLLG